MRTRNLLPHLKAYLFGIVFGVFSLGAAFATPPTELTVGLYPYVPRIDQFKSALQSEWHKVQPNVQLNFLTFEQWDGGYVTTPPANADVYVFDALFFENYRQQNLMEPLQTGEISNLNDFLPYALDGVRVAGQYYAIPQLGCANLLLYDKHDTAIKNATTISQLTNVLQQCTYTSQIPPDRRGLLISMADPLTNAALYLDTEHDITQQYPYPQPAMPAELDPIAISNLRQVLSIGSFLNATTFTPGAYDFATYFSNGWGRAYVGFSESMSQLTASARNNIDFKVMPFSNSPPGGQADFFADVIAVSPTVNQRGTRALAVQLANVMAATTTMIKSIGPSGNLPPQYLMATRPSVFVALKQNDPIYAKMHDLTNSSNPVMFKLDSQAPSWLASMQNNIRSEILSAPMCGCDFPAVQTIPNNSAAAAICTNTCSTHGGWNGQWTNQPPAAQDGSVCGCNACPTPP